MEYNKMSKQGERCYIRFISHYMGQSDFMVTVAGIRFDEFRIRVRDGVVSSLMADELGHSQDFIEGMHKLYKDGEHQRYLEYCARRGFTPELV